jgi:hypothetical protein
MDKQITEAPKEKTWGALADQAMHNPYVDLAVGAAVGAVAVWSRGKLTSVAESLLPKASSLLGESIQLGTASTGLQAVTENFMRSTLFSRSTEELVSLARSAKVSPRVLDTLAAHFSPDVLEGIAQNKLTTAGTLMKLSDSAAFTPTLAKSMARNPNAAGALLEKLAKHAPLEVSGHPNALPETLARLAEERRSDTMSNLYQIRLNIAKNLNTPATVLKKLSEDPRASIRQAVKDRFGKAVSADTTDSSSAAALRKMTPAEQAAAAVGGVAPGVGAGTREGLLDIGAKRVAALDKMTPAELAKIGQLPGGTTASARMARLATGAAPETRFDFLKVPGATGSEMVSPEVGWTTRVGPDPVTAKATDYVRVPNDPQNYASVPSRGLNTEMRPATEATIRDGVTPEVVTGVRATSPGMISSTDHPLFKLIQEVHTFPPKTGERLLEIGAQDPDALSDVMRFIKLPRNDTPAMQALLAETIPNADNIHSIKRLLDSVDEARRAWKTPEIQREKLSLAYEALVPLTGTIEQDIRLGEYIQNIVNTAELRVIIRSNMASRLELLPRTK